jgi:hypothetical protein
MDVTRRDFLTAAATAASATAVPTPASPATLITITKHGLPISLSG